MAQDKPTVDFNFDTFKSEAEHKPYGIVIDGKHVALPPASELKGIEFFENSMQGDAYATVAMLKAILTEEQYQSLRKAATIEALQAFIRGYLAASGMGKAA